MSISGMPSFMPGYGGCVNRNLPEPVAMPSPVPYTVPASYPPVQTYPSVQYPTMPSIPVYNFPPATTPAASRDVAVQREFTMDPSVQLPFGFAPTAATQNSLTAPTETATMMNFLGMFLQLLQMMMGTSGTASPAFTTPSGTNPSAPQNSVVVPTPPLPTAQSPVNNTTLSLIQRLTR